MLLGLDHVVIVCDDLVAAVAALRDEVGLEASGGGRHEALGTENSLVWLGDTYVELLAVVDAARAAESWIGRPALTALRRGGGFATYALATDDLAADVARLRGAGSRLGEPTQGERRRPDGEIVRWRLSVPPELGPDRPPFLIEHELEGAEWAAPAREARAAAVHPLGGRARIRRFELAVPDPPAVAARYAADVGLRFEPPGSSILEAHVGHGHEVQTIRLLPAGHERPSSGLVISISSGRPRRVDLLGCRFILEPEDG